MSTAGDLHKAFPLAQQIGCETIQLFTKNANRWRAKPLQDDQISRFQDAWQATEIGPVVAHDSYLINLATPKAELQHKSQAGIVDEVRRCAQLGIPYLVVHPGAHVGSGEADGLKRIAEALDAVHAQTEEAAVKILLETTAGQGTTLGYRFEQLATIIDAMHHPERLGICLDTCHVFAAGYDLRDEAEYDRTFKQLDAVLGLEHLKVIHLNDSVKACGSRVDRHAGIGQGEIGLKGFRHLMNDPRLQEIPMILETPKGKDPVKSDQENLAILRRLIQQRTD